MPTDTEEQIRIGVYFKNLDHLITLHQRKYLQKKKTSLTWEQRKLNELLEKYEDPVDTPHNGYERIASEVMQRVHFIVLWNLEKNWILQKCIELPLINLY